MAENRLEFSSAVYFPTTSPPAPCALAALDEVTLFAPSPVPSASLSRLSPPAFSFCLPTLCPSLFFQMGPFQPLSPSSLILPLLWFLSPSSHSPDPCCWPDSGTKQGEGSQTGLANDRVTKSSVRPMRSRGGQCLHQSGELLRASGLDKRN